MAQCDAVAASELKKNIFSTMARTDRVLKTGQSG